MDMTTQTDISRWFDRGIEQSARHMIVVCDTFDHEDYPVYTKTDDECIAKVNAPGEMQRVMEVYDLRESKAAQLSERRAWRLPPTTSGPTP